MSTKAAVSQESLAGAVAILDEQLQRGIVGPQNV
jgi:hypothetical protein